MIYQHILRYFDEIAPGQAFGYWSKASPQALPLLFSSWVWMVEERCGPSFHVMHLSFRNLLSLSLQDWWEKSHWPVQEQDLRALTRDVKYWNGGVERQFIRNKSLPEQAKSNYHFMVFNSMFVKARKQSRSWNWITWITFQFEQWLLGNGW